MSRRNLKIAVGISAAVIFFLLVGFAAFQQLKEEPEAQTSGEQAPGVHLQVDSAPIEYAGGPLDWMEGVRAWDESGRDWTDNVRVTVSQESTVSRKVLIYSLIGPDNRLLTEERILNMNQYSGPKLKVQDPLQVYATELTDLVSVLHSSRRLQATDGYRKDITEQVTFFREHLHDSEYLITFSILNDFRDKTSKSVRCIITGKVKDPRIELQQETVSIAAGSEFDPKMMILLAQHEDGSDASDDVLIDSAVLVNTPGTYQVVYRLLSRDETSCETKALRVIVK